MSEFLALDLDPLPLPQSFGGGGSARYIPSELDERVVVQVKYGELMSKLDARLKGLVTQYTSPTSPPASLHPILCGKKCPLFILRVLRASVPIFASLFLLSLVLLAWVFLGYTRHSQLTPPLLAHITVFVALSTMLALGMHIARPANIQMQVKRWRERSVETSSSAETTDSIAFTTANEVELIAEHRRVMTEFCNKLVDVALEKMLVKETTMEEVSLHKAFEMRLRFVAAQQHQDN
jgi:hypothetical protein